MAEFKKLTEELEATILASYEQGISLENAERLAARFLYAQLAVSAELRKSSLDARMRKSGLKAIRAAVYTDAATKPEKKPTEAQLAAIVDTNDIVESEQNALDTAEVERDDLQRLYDVYGNAHIYFRGVAKGAFGA